MHPAYILAGGQSRRFGSDKARHPTSAGPQLIVLVDQLIRAGHAVHVVADRADRYRDLGLECLVDVQPDCGPLSGLGTALVHHRSTCGTTVPREAGWLMLVSCDQLHWQMSWYTGLAQRVDRLAQAIVYYDSKWQPLPGLYHWELATTVLERIDQRQLSLHALLDSLAGRTRKVATAEPPSRWSFNTPAELDE